MKPQDGPSTTAILAQQCLSDSERWFGDTMNIRDIGHHVLALCGEAGELANIIKKIQRGSLDIHDANVRHDIAMEVADVYIYLLNIAGIFRLDLEKIYVAKRSVNDKRFLAQRALREDNRARVKREFERTNANND